MSLNKEHPKFSEYNQRFWQLVDEQNKEHDKVEKENPNFRGLDGPTAIVDKKYALKIKALQEEYSFLFEEDS